MITWVLQNGADTAVDDLCAILNPLQQTDLEGVLRLTPLSRRVDVMLAWADLTVERWCAEAGFTEATVSRWLHGLNRMPFGGAVRLARILGVNPMLIFEAQLSRMEPLPVSRAAKRRSAAAPRAVRAPSSLDVSEDSRPN